MDHSEGMAKCGGPTRSALGMCLIVRKQHEEGFKQMVIAAIGVGTILCCSYFGEIAFGCPVWEGGDEEGVLPEAAEIW